MATNGFSRAGRSGRTPHFLTVGLLVVICILAFNYWNVSSQNKMLQKEREEMTRNLEELALRRVHLEKRSEALDNQLRENNQNIQALTSDKNSCLTSLKETGDERDDLRTKLTENDEQLKELQRELEANNQQLDDKYEQVRTTERKLAELQNQFYMKENELQQYQNRNTELQQTVQTLSMEKEQCYNAYRALESKHQQALQLNQANLPPVPPQNKLSPDSQQQQQQQQQLMQNGIQPGQSGGQINMGPQVPGNIQVPGVPNVPVYMNQGVPPLQTGGEKGYGRLPQLPDMTLNRLPLPVPGDKNVPGSLDDEKSEGEDNVKMEEKSEIGEEKGFDQQDAQLKQSENNGDSKPMVHVDPGMVNQVDGDDGEDVREDSAQQALDGKEPEDGEDKGDAPSVDLKDEKQISENVVDGGLSNMDSESDDDDQGDPDKAIDANGPSDADEFDSEKEEKGGLQIDRGDIADRDEEQDDDKLRFEGLDIQNQLNPAPNNK